MVGFHVFNPLLYAFTHIMPKLIGPLYRTFGIPGILALPWITLATERVAYDTFAAARGYDLKKEQDERGGNAHGEFPSGGAGMPNMSLIPVRGEADRLIIPYLDRPRGEPPAAPTA